jgi:diguanylate cyclase (GGDEF)-like protein/PAS domain S-box-containing protein
MSSRRASELASVALELLDHLDAMVAFWDRNQVCVFANKAYFNWFGKTPDQIIGGTMEELLGPIYPLNLPYIRAALAGERQQFERAIPTPGGGIRDSLATYTPYVVDGEVLGFFAHVADVTPLKQLERELELARAAAHQQATHDFLTGLPNRVLLVDRITQAIAGATRRREMVAVMSLDLDNLKMINDQYGHAAGDALLVEAATRLRKSLRDTDVLCRLGGDEFILVAPEIKSMAEVRSLAERLLGLLLHPVVVNGVELVPAASIGVAMYPSNGTTPEALLANSDAALYAAKKRGGRQFAVSEHMA